MDSLRVTRWAGLRLFGITPALLDHSGAFRGAGVAAKHGPSANNGHAGSFNHGGGPVNHGGPAAGHAGPSPRHMGRATLERVAGWLLTAALPAGRSGGPAKSRPCGRWCQSWRRRTFSRGHPQQVEREAAELLLMLQPAGSERGPVAARHTRQPPQVAQAKVDSHRIRLLQPVVAQDRERLAEARLIVHRPGGAGSIGRSNSAYSISGWRRRQTGRNGCRRSPHACAGGGGVHAPAGGGGAPKMGGGAPHPSPSVTHKK